MRAIFRFMKRMMTARWVKKRFYLELGFLGAIWELADMLVYSYRGVGCGFGSFCCFF